MSKNCEKTIKNIKTVKNVEKPRRNPSKISKNHQICRKTWKKTSKMSINREKTVKNV